MCFSATASFGAGVFLVGAGMVAIKKIDSPKTLAFASVPFVFGVQQIAEGVLWLSLTHPKMASWHHLAMYTFLFISQVLWPLAAPYSLWLIEPNRGKKKVIFYFMLIGAALALYMLYCLFAYESTAIVESRHIRYTIPFPYRILHRGAYFLATVVPIFLSSWKWMKLLGATMLGSLILSFLVFVPYVISVWCFFAAILSLLVIFIITQNKGIIHPSTS